MASATPAPTTPGHWYGADLREQDWRLPIPRAVIEELDAALADPQAETGPHAGAGMDATRAFLARVRAAMFEGPGLAVTGRLPVAEWGERRSRRAAALLSRLMGPLTEQTHDGVTLYAVEDRGLRPGPGVRRSLTNVSQPFHSDGPWVRRPPAVVSLYCLRTAREGGVSRCISLRTLFHDLAARAPRLGARLQRDFFWHRQSEHAPGDTPVSVHPMQWRDESGRWAARFYGDYVVNGYRSAGQPMDEDAGQALERLAELAAEPHRRAEFRLAAGDIEWVNNRWCAHARTGFEPRSQTDSPRLMLRVWHRAEEAGVGLDD